MNEEDPQDVPEHESLMAEASDWFGRMRGPEADLHRPAFEAWLARGALHRAFYNRAGEIYAMGKFLRDEHHSAAGEDVDGSAEPIHPDVQSSLWRRLVLPLVLVLAASLAFFAIYSTLIGHSRGELAKSLGSKNGPLLLATQAGQTLTQTLPDGSKVTLEPKSRLRVAYSASERTLLLERGRSRFEVAHEARPFVVLAGKGRITARGTIFEVAVGDSDKVTVRLVRGKVDVALPGPKDSKPAVHHMIAGDVISYASAAPSNEEPAPTSTPASINSTASPMPESTTREFVDTPINEVLALSNARGGTQIRLQEPGMSILNVSGRLRLDDASKLADKLSFLFDLDVTRNTAGDFVLQYRKK